MSLQNYNPAARGTVSYTYESLSRCVEDLTKQLTRAKAAADSLENEDDFRKFVRLSKTQEDNRTKFDNFKKALLELRRSEPGAPLDPEISSGLDAAQRMIESLTQQIAPIRTRQEELEAQRKAAAEEHARLMAEQQAASKEQEEALQQQDDLNMIQREMNDIVDQATIVNEATHEVDQVVTDSHETVVHIDETIQDAAGEMKAGNEDLEVGEDDQKSSSKVIWIILGVVVTIVVIVGVILGLKFGGVM
jgi:predicted  nucleic acid-binding Zn-ribbon protein